MHNVIEFINKENLGAYNEDVSFKTLTTYKTGGIAKLVVYPNDTECVIKLVKYLKDNNISYKVLGNGSNILASDKTYNGVIIKLKNLNKKIINNNLVEVEAGYSLVLLANEICNLGYTGFEFACGIPGTVGGAIYMNAGAYLKDIDSLIVNVTFLDENQNIKTFTREDLNLGYRSSIFMNNNYIILKAIFKIEEGDINYIKALVKERKERRLETQPLEYPSAGSVFRNPEGNYAGKLIEDSNLKGYTLGGAKVSEKHANFIINYNNATSTDIKNLIDKVKKEVKNNYDIDLKQEQELFNWE